MPYLDVRLEVIGSMGYFTYTYKWGIPWGEITHTDPITFDPNFLSGTSKYHLFDLFRHFNSPFLLDFCWFKHFMFVTFFQRPQKISEGRSYPGLPLRCGQVKIYQSHRNARNRVLLSAVRIFAEGVALVFKILVQVWCFRSFFLGVQSYLLRRCLDVYMKYIEILYAYISLSFPYWITGHVKKNTPMDLIHHYLDVLGS